MKSQQELNYNRIADAIRFIKKNYRTQPKLEEIAEHINMSPFHFQGCLASGREQLRSVSCNI